jgi:hypothetical protein
LTSKNVKGQFFNYSQSPPCATGNHLMHIHNSNEYFL